MTGKQEDASGAIGGFLFGALVGAAVGLLKAPSSGEELRARIQSRISGLASSARQSVPGSRGQQESVAAADEGLVIRPADSTPDV